MKISAHFDNIGVVTFTQSAKAKYQRITIRPDKAIIVTIPRHGSLNEAKQFLLSRMAWVRKQLQTIELNDKLHDTADMNIDIEKAQDDLFGRLEKFSGKYHLPYNRASFRCQKTKWGSCSGRNNINLNINIAFLPPELQDYILLHELTHTKVKNHSKLFWAQLDSYVNGKAKEMAKQLKKYRLKFRI
jgi:predicted metal-dependent hydrolase